MLMWMPLMLIHKNTLMGDIHENCAQGRYNIFLELKSLFISKHPTVWILVVCGYASFLPDQFD